MADIALKAFMLGDCTFKVQADNYEASVSQVQFDPQSSVVVFKGLKKGSSKSFPTPASWNCTVAYAQDWSTEGSLSRYLHEHEGEEIDVEFEPVAGGPAVLATLIVAPGSIGGAVDAVATATVTLGVQGKPEIEEPPAPVGG